MSADDAPKLTFSFHASLLVRCQRKHGWTLRKTRDVARAYKQFMCLKKVHEDWDATELSPSEAVDTMWHEHMLDPKDYYRSCQNFCGEHIGHNPDGGLDVSGRETRRRHTLNALVIIFGLDNFDAAIWESEEPRGSLSPSPVPPARRSKRQRSQSRARDNSVGEKRRKAADDSSRSQASHLMSASNPNSSESSDKPSAGSDSDIVNLTLVDLGQEEIHFRGKKSIKIQKLYTAYMDHTYNRFSRPPKSWIGRPLKYLLYDGRRLPLDRTLGECGVEDGSRIDVMSNQRGC